MFNATHLIYNNIHSATFGLRIGSFNDEKMQETTVFSPSITTVKSKNSKRFVASNINEENAPECELTLISELPIHDILKREILSWLNSGKEFKKLIVEKPCTEEYYYMCKFRDIREIKVNNQCVGYSMTAVFDSPYQYGRSTELKLEEDKYNEHSFVLVNKSDLPDDYTYPFITLTSSINNGRLIIQNQKEGMKPFELTGLLAGETITIDNELKIIEGKGATLNNFNKNWLKLIKGENNIAITFEGSITITCPQIIAVGF